MALASNRETVSTIIPSTTSSPTPAIVSPISSPDSRDLATRDLAFSSVCWRAIFAGVFIAFMTYLILASLGIAVGGHSLANVIRGTDSLQGFGIGSGIWLVVSCIISLFIGSFAAGRIAGIIPIKIGRAQGAVIASLFFIFMITQLGGAVGSLGAGLGKSVSAVGGAVGDLAQNPDVQDTIENAMGDLNLKSSPGIVVQGVAARLLRGDTVSARDYLARQAGISTAEADRRINNIKSNFQNIVNNAAFTASRIVTVAGWTLFGTFLLGVISALIGGSVGARMNLIKPLSSSDVTALENQNKAA